MLNYRMLDHRPLYNSIVNKLTLALAPAKLVVTDQSHMHRGHAGVKEAESPETHFNVDIVSDKFTGKSRLDRQRMVNTALQVELDNGLHSISLSCKTPEESARE